MSNDNTDPHVDALLFREFADNLPTLCWAAYDDGYIFWYNRRWYEYTGTTAADMAGWGWQSVHDPGRLPEVLERWTAAIRTGEPFEMVFPLRGTDGGFRPFLTRVSPLRDASGTITRWFGVNTDVAPQVAAETALRTVAENNALLTQELSHRIKNIFTIVSGLISLSTRHEPGMQQFASQLSDRIAALGRAHDFARPHSPTSQPGRGEGMLHALLRDLFVPYASDNGERIMVSGDDLTVDDRAVTPLALIYHELATNAMKYGALSAARGHVDLMTRLENGRLTLTWREHGGPVVAVPAKAGFGTQLTTVSIERQLGGSLERQWHRDGLVVQIIVDASRLMR